MGRLWLSTSKAQLDSGLLLTTPNMSKPKSTFQITLSVRCLTHLLSSPTLSSALSLMLAFQPLSALIDVLNYSGRRRPRILAQSRNHILHKPPPPWPRLRAPVSSRIMGSRIERQLWISTLMTMTHPNRHVSRPNSLLPGPLSTLAPFLKGPCLLSHQRH